MIDASDTATMMLVTLSIADQLCGIPVKDVRDVLGPRAITRIPLTPPEIAGNLNLRGRIVTAMDLRRRLGLPDPAPDSPRMSLVTEHDGELYALLVDCVLEVVTLPSDTLEANPPTLPCPWARYSAGIVQLAGGLLVKLDVPRLLDLAH